MPAEKVKGKIAEVRGLKEGEDAISPARFPDLNSVEDYQKIAEEVRLTTGGIPIGFKMSANHIEEDIDFAMAVGVDYIILDGRGGGTGAAPLIFRNNISVPTLPALARARRHLDKLGADHVTLIVTGGLRTPDDFIKAMCLGADGIALSNSAIQALDVWRCGLVIQISVLWELRLKTNHCASVWILRNQLINCSNFLKHRSL